MSKLSMMITLIVRLINYIGEGDYAVVNVTGKARVVRYIARIDEVNDGEYEGVFLHKVPSCLKDECISFLMKKMTHPFLQVISYSNCHLQS